MNIHEHVHELLGPYALNALDEVDASLVRNHVARCAVCRAELADFNEVAGRLATLNPSQQPPPRLRRRVLAAVECEARSQTSPPRPRQLPLRLQWQWVALALIVLIIQGWLLLELTSLQNLLHQQQQIQTVLLSSDEPPIKLQSPDPASGAHGFYRAEAELGQGLLNYYQLPPPGANQSYQCWFESTAGAATACGRLPLEPDGHGILLITIPERQLDRIRVTLETGRPTTPRGPTILAADLIGE
jgi:hypothetical protein